MIDVLLQSKENEIKELKEALLKVREKLQVSLDCWYMVARLRRKENISLRKHIDSLQELLDKRDEIIVLQNVKMGLLERLREINSQGVQ